MIPFFNKKIKITNEQICRKLGNNKKFRIKNQNYKLVRK